MGKRIDEIGRKVRKLVELHLEGMADNGEEMPGFDDRRPGFFWQDRQDSNLRPSA